MQVLVDRGKKLIERMIQSGLNEMETRRKWANGVRNSISKAIDSIHDTDSVAILTPLDNQFCSSLAKKLLDHPVDYFSKIISSDLFSRLEYLSLPDETLEALIVRAEDLLIEEFRSQFPIEALQMEMARQRSDVSAILSILRGIANEIARLNARGLNLHDVNSINRHLQEQSADDLQIDLNFFDIDYDQHKEKLDSLTATSGSLIKVIYEDTEEALYRVLSHLQYSLKNVFVVDDEDTWRQLVWLDSKSEFIDSIMIARFESDRISIIPGCCCIVFQKSYDNFEFGSWKSLPLRRRTRDNITRALITAGMETAEANRLVTKTQGEYRFIRRRILKETSTMSGPDRELSKPMAIALLCGHWTDSDLDKEFISFLGCDWDELLDFTEKGNDSIKIDRTMLNGRNVFEVRAYEDTLKLFDKAIGRKQWRIFFDAIPLLFQQHDSLFDKPFEEHPYARFTGENPPVSNQLRQGVLQCLCIRAVNSSSWETSQQIDAVIHDILQSVTTKSQWAEISSFLPLMAEASPDVVISKIENSFGNRDGVINIFTDVGGGLFDHWGYYAGVQNALVRLAQMDGYTSRALDMFTRFGTLDLNFGQFADTPSHYLRTALCPWYRTIPFDTREKLEYLKSAIDKWPWLWNVVVGQLLTRGGASCSPLPDLAFRKRSFKEEEIKVEEQYRAFDGYLDLCVKYLPHDADHINRLLLHIELFGFKRQKEVIDGLKPIVDTLCDDEKLEVFISLRSTISRNRISKNGLPDNYVALYEDLYNSIKFANRLYSYLYIFCSEYEYRLLDPASENSKDCFAIIAQETSQKLEEFKEEKLSLPELVKLAFKCKRTDIGRVLARCWDNGHFCEEAFSSILEDDEIGEEVFYYVYFLNSDVKEAHFTDILDRVRERYPDKPACIASVIATIEITDHESAVIRKESEEIKKAFWSDLRGLRAVRGCTGKSLDWAIDECVQFGTQFSLLFLLVFVEDRINNDQLFDYLLKLINMEGSPADPVAIATFIDRLYPTIVDDEEKCSHLMEVELYYRRTLGWEDMKCTRHLMSTKPEYYLSVVVNAFKNDAGEVDEHNVDSAQAIQDYETFVFCPCEKDGQVDYNELKAWVDSYKELLASNNRTHCFAFIPKLLVHAPVDKDGRTPCEAVCKIVEEYADHSFMNNYSCCEVNKRGVYYMTAGKEELALSRQYADAAERLEDKGFSKLASIFRDVSTSYAHSAERERREAENGDCF